MEDMYIEGYAVLYNSPTVLYEYEGIKYYEVVDPGALYGTNIEKCCLRYNHSDHVYITAAVRNKTLELINDSKGLKIRAKLVNTSVGKDLYEMVKTRLLSQMSFAFSVEDDDFNVKTKTRTIKKINTLYDVSCVNNGAYPETSVYVLDEQQRKSLDDNEKELRSLKDDIKKREAKFQADQMRAELKKQGEKQELDWLKKQINAKK